MSVATYPDTPSARDRWVLDRREPAQPHDPWTPVGFFVEGERAHSGEVVPVATVLLTNRECPFRCAMCDLWQQMLADTVPSGAILAQLDYALARLPPTRQVKLYNAGSFFDPRAIPQHDLSALAKRLRNFERVIVECHPAFLGDECTQFAGRLEGKLEVAIGLETAHPETLDRLNKRMTLEQFERAAEFLAQREITLRVFVLVRPPFLPAEHAAEWTQRSAEFAFECGAMAVSLIPTRPGNGALEALREQGLYSPPHLSELEAAHAAAIAPDRGRVFADTWDLERFSDCPACFPARLNRLRTMNEEQSVLPPIRCPACG
ncbi:MAG: radical SAM protein [Chthoniobacteraceae bacterium]